MNDFNINYRYIFINGEAEERAVFLLEKIFTAYGVAYNYTNKKLFEKSEIRVFEIDNNAENDDLLMLCTSGFTEEIKKFPPDNVKKIVTCYAENQDLFTMYFKYAKIIQFGINEPKADITGLNVRKLENKILSFELLTNEGISRIKLPFYKNMIEAALGVSGILSAFGVDSFKISRIMNSIL